jgi:DNA-3-methyladenine glycosylase I
LKKRENYREVFDGFDYEKIAKYSDSKLEKILKNP